MKRTLITILLLSAFYVAFDHQRILASVNSQLSQAPALARVINLLQTVSGGAVYAAAPQLTPALTQQTGLAYLASYAQEKGYGDLAQVRVTKVEIDDLGMGHTRVQQIVSGVPVWGGEAIVHLNNDGSLFAITDSLLKVGNVDINPGLSSKDAIERAKALYAGSAYLTADPTTDLWVWHEQDRDRLVYRVQLRREDGSAETAMPVYFIDAQTGAKVWDYDNLQTQSATGTGVSLYSGTVSLTTYRSSTNYYLEDVSRKVGTFDYRNSTSNLARFTDTDNAWDAATQKAGVDAQYGASKTYDYFKNVHGRTGIDGQGGPASTTSIDGVTGLIGNRVHYSRNYNNAFWNGQYMTYGDGDGTTFTPLVTLDIIGHEMTHGITERTAGLVYSGESGALNESMSDVFGALVERYAKGTGPNTWKIGEQCYTPANGTDDALRYMDNPHLASNSGFTSDDDPDHYSERYTGASDNGGVHINSGIGNKAFYLVAQGGAHHLGGSMTGIGADAAAAIWYRALTTYMTASTNFAGARTATLNAAAALYGTGSTQYVAVAKAWCLVGVGACENTPPPPPSESNLLVNGGFENSLSPWVPSGVGALYTNNGNYPQAGTGYIYFGGSNNVSGQTYQQITLPGTTTSATLAFYLNVTSAETTTTTAYDKLFVEVRNTAGTLLGTLATYSNLNKANAGVYSQKSLSLLAYKGQTVRLQFRTTTDSSAITTFRVDTASVQVAATGCPTLTLSSLTAGSAGTAFNQTVTVSPAGGSYTFAVTGGTLPTGLALATNGTLSGTPTAAGTYNFTLTATSSTGCAKVQAYTLVINAACATINPATLPVAKAGTAYSQQLTANVTGAYSLQAGPLPAGLNLSAAGLISGTPTQTGSYSITVRLTTATCTSLRPYTLTVGSATLTFGAVLGHLADYDGDGKSDPVLWSAQDGAWRILHSSEQQEETQTWGTRNDVSLLGDYDGDGKTDLAVFRPSDGTWYVKQSSDGSFLVKPWGVATDVPVPGDYDGDGKTDFAVWRPSEGNWYVLRSSDEQATVTAWGAGAAPYLDVPVVGDYDGDGLSDLAVFRRATGTWLVKRSSDGQYLVKVWGVATDVPVAADYDGDGKTDLAVWRGTTGTWYIWQSATNTYQMTEWGAQSAPYFDQVVPGDYDGDGRADLAVWRASDQTWYLRFSADNSVLAKPQGQAGDAPVNAPRP